MKITPFRVTVRHYAAAIARAEKGLKKRPGSEKEEGNVEVQV
jgi:hypothetical protein